MHGVDGRRGDSLRYATQHVDGRDRRRHAGAAGAVVNMQGTLSRVVRAIIRRVVVVMAVVIVVVTIMIMVVMMAMVVVTMVVVTMVNVEEEARGDARRRPI